MVLWCGGVTCTGDVVPQEHVEAVRKRYKDAVQYRVTLKFMYERAKAEQITFNTTMKVRMCIGVSCVCYEDRAFHMGRGLRMFHN